METLAIIVIIFIWCLFGGAAWVLLKGEPFGFRFAAWFISGYFGTVATLKVVVDLSYYFGWV